MTVKFVKVSKAAEHYSCSVRTLYRWRDEAKIQYKTTPSGGTLFGVEIEETAKTSPTRFEAHYCRVSATTEQETSLITQAQQLFDSKTSENFVVYKDNGSGLNENRKSLTKLLLAVKEGKITVVRITHKDRLTRFGYKYLEELFAAYGATIEVLFETERKSPESELLQDFMNLLASFSGKFYGLRSNENQKKLLVEAGDTLGTS